MNFPRIQISHNHIHFETWTFPFSNPEIKNYSIYISHSLLLLRKHALFSISVSIIVSHSNHDTKNFFSFLKLFYYAFSCISLEKKKYREICWLLVFLFCIPFPTRGIRMMMTWFDRFGWLLSLHKFILSYTSLVHFIFSTLDNIFFYIFLTVFTSIRWHFHEYFNHFVILHFFTFIYHYLSPYGPSLSLVFWMLHHKLLP